MRQRKQARCAGCSDVTRSRCCGGWCSCPSGRCQCDQTVRPLGSCCWPEGFTGELSGYGEEWGENRGEGDEESGEGCRTEGRTGEAIRDADGFLDSGGLPEAIDEVSAASGACLCAKEASTELSEEKQGRKLAETANAGSLKSRSANHIGGRSQEERGDTPVDDGLVMDVGDMCGERRKHERSEHLVPCADVFLDESNPFSVGASGELVQTEGLLEDDPLSVNIGHSLPLMEGSDAGSCGCGPGPCLCDPSVLQSGLRFDCPGTVPKVSADAGMVAGGWSWRAEGQQEYGREGVEVNRRGRAVKEVTDVLSGPASDATPLDGQCCNAEKCRCGRGLCRCPPNAKPPGSCCTGPRTLPETAAATRTMEEAGCCSARRRQLRKKERVELDGPVRDALDELDIFSGNVRDDPPLAEWGCNAKNCRCGPERCRGDPNVSPPSSCCSGPRTVPKLAPTFGILEWSRLQSARKEQDGRQAAAFMDEQAQVQGGELNIFSESIKRAMPSHGHCCKASNCECGPEICHCDPKFFLSGPWCGGSRVLSNAAVSREILGRVGRCNCKHQQKNNEETKGMSAPMKEMERLLEFFSGRMGQVIGLGGQCSSCKRAILDPEQSRCQVIGLPAQCCSCCGNAALNAERCRPNSNFYSVGCSCSSGAGTFLEGTKVVEALTGARSCCAERRQQGDLSEDTGANKTPEVDADAQEQRRRVESSENDLMARLLERRIPELSGSFLESGMAVGSLGGKAKSVPCSGVEDKVVETSKDQGGARDQRKEDEKVGFQSSIESFQCKECTSRFKNKRELTYHTRTIHRGERIFKCDRCSEGFFYKQNRDRHITEVHLSRRPFSCPVEGCGVAFKNRGGLKQHQKTVHNKERPYRCPRDGCSRAFGQRNHLTHHIATVHEKKRPFKCSHCEYRFSNRGNLNQHIRRKHPGVLEQNGENNRQGKRTRGQ